MGWMRALRSLEAAARRHAREMDRQQRHLTRLNYQQAKSQAKYDAIQSAVSEVQEYEDLVGLLTGIGRECGASINWQKESQLPEPVAPEQRWEYKAAAEAALEAYKPGIFERIFGSPEKKRYNLSKEAFEAGQLDEKLHIIAHERYVSEWENWKERLDLSQRVLGGELEVYGEILKELSPFACLDEVGSHFSFTFTGKLICAVEIDVNDISIVPRLTKTLTATGKVKESAMPSSKRLDIYQDYVCGALFRVARELFSLLPLRFVIGTAFCMRINSSTGHLERVCLVSAAFRPETLNGIDFNQVDFSDATQRFPHRMEFSRKTGFEPVLPQEISEFDLSDLSVQ